MNELPEHIALMEASLAGAEEATTREDRFAALVRRRARFVFGVAYSVLRNTHDAEDVVQEAFLKIYRWRKWDSVLDERAFLARVVWRIAIDRLPKIHPDGANSEMASNGETPEQAAISADWNAAVHRLMDALPEPLRQPLALSAVEELTSQQIAQVMGIPEGTVRTRLMRARQILKQKLGALKEERHGR